MSKISTAVMLDDNAYQLLSYVKEVMRRKVNKPKMRISFSQAVRELWNNKEDITEMGFKIYYGKIKNKRKRDGFITKDKETNTEAK